jgi:hypothetical protein
MNSRVTNSIAVGILLVIGGVALLKDPKCKCGCPTLGEHLIKAGFEFVSGLSG